jgi:hypothetical protein
LDGLPSEEYESASVEFDRCDTACLEETRGACEARSDESRFSGRIKVSRINEAGDVVFVDDETYAVPGEQLYAQDCHPEGVPERTITSDVVVNAGSGAAPAPDAPPPEPESSTAVCPVP